MLTINLANKELDNRTLYMLTKSADRIGLRAYPTDVIKIDTFIVYTNDTGKFIAIKDNDGVILVTNSATFIEEFEDLFGIFGQELTAVKRLVRKTKNGRDYNTCTLAD